MQPSVFISCDPCSVFSIYITIASVCVNHETIKHKSSTCEIKSNNKETKREACLKCSEPYGTNLFSDGPWAFTNVEEPKFTLKLSLLWIHGNCFLKSTHSSESRTKWNFLCSSRGWLVEANSLSCYRWPKSRRGVVSSTFCIRVQNHLELWRLTWISYWQHISPIFGPRVPPVCVVCGPVPVNEVIHFLPFIIGP